jgi:poly(A) polymerase
LRVLWNTIHRKVFYLGVYFNWWQGPKRYKLKQLGLSPRDFNRQVQEIAKTLQKKGHDAYIVGGSLRDLLSKQRSKPKDFDIATSARPQQVKRVFSRSRIIGKRFKIVHVPMGRDVVEVSTFRGFSWFSFLRGVRHSNNLYGTIEQDAYRRDFTANALYYDCLKEEVIDFTNGVQDIKAKKLVMIGQCSHRFKEDPVRILRAIRFAAKTGLRMDAQMRHEIRSKKRLLHKVSRDRLLLEVVKLFSQGHSVASLKLLQDFDCLSILFPGYERLSINFEYYQPFLDAASHTMDQRYHKKQRLSTSFLFAVLLWPIYNTQRSKVKKNTIYHCKKLVNRVLRFEAKVVALPKKLQEAITDLWMLQQALETKDSAFRVEHDRRARLEYALEFFMLRAKSDDSLTEKALMWQSVYAEKTDNNNQA